MTSFLHAIDHVLFFPGKVVVVLKIQQYLGPEVCRHVLVNEGMVGCCVAAHQLHRFPILLAFLGIQR